MLLGSQFRNAARRREATRRPSFASAMHRVRLRWIESRDLKQFLGEAHFASG
jgi:hypothetical protein